jgi:hypothetical protein
MEIFGDQPKTLPRHRQSNHHFGSVHQLTPRRAAEILGAMHGGNRFTHGPMRARIGIRKSMNRGSFFIGSTL